MTRGKSCSQSTASEATASPLSRGKKMIDKIVQNKSKTQQDRKGVGVSSERRKGERVTQEMEKIRGRASPSPNPTQSPQSVRISQNSTLRPNPTSRQTLRKGPKHSRQ